MRCCKSAQSKTFETNLRNRDVQKSWTIVTLVTSLILTLTAFQVQMMVLTLLIKYAMQYGHDPIWSKWEKWKTTSPFLDKGKLIYYWHPMSLQFLNFCSFLISKLISPFHEKWYIFIWYIFIHSNLVSYSLIGSLINTRIVLKMSTALRVLRPDCASCFCWVIVLSTDPFFHWVKLLIFFTLVAL